MKAVLERGVRKGPREVSVSPYGSAKQVQLQQSGVGNKKEECRIE